MAEIGEINTLKVIKIDSYGALLDAEDFGEILLPKRLVPKDCKEDDLVEVFLFVDAKERVSATTAKPKAKVGEVAFLKVAQTTAVGAFLDWGLPKDLLVPFSNQRSKMQQGQMHVVYVYLDENTDRVVASSKLNRFIMHDNKSYTKGQAVDLIITDITDIGYKAVINHRHWGLLFFDDVIKQLKVGDQCKGYVMNLRDDGRIDLSLQALGYGKVKGLREQILDALAENEGFLPLSDKSPAEDIYEKFGVSKKSFKMTIGTLYRQRLIVISREGITLVEKPKRA
jgi:hypothetical protein